MTISTQARASLARARALPPYVRSAIEAAYATGAPPARGTIPALDRFFSGLEAAGRPLDCPIAEDFSRERSRTAFRTLMEGLARFAPDVPLVEASTQRRDWDRELNAAYNAKPQRERAPRQVGLPPELWPRAWRAALPSLDRSWVAADGRRRPRLRPKTRESVLQAVGMLVASVHWARDNGVDTGPDLDVAAIEVFLRYMHHARGASTRTIADYLDRIRILGRRGALLSWEADAVCGEIIAALRDEAADEQAKAGKLRAFLRDFSLGDVVRRAEINMAEAARLPAHRAGAAKLRREAVVLMMLLNTCDRQGDLSHLRIGQELVRDREGAWTVDHEQSKSGIRKDLPLWPLTCRMLDQHLLGGRPARFLEERVRELHGSNLFSLQQEAFDTHYPSSVMHRTFGIRAHLIRTLMTDMVRRERPDSAWIARVMLGHADETMQGTYQVEFRRDASFREWHAVIEEMAVESDAAGPAGRRNGVD